MKKIILTAALVLGLFVISSESYGQIKYYSTEVMDEINATPEQREAVKELVAGHNKKIRALRADKSLSKEETETQRRKLVGERSRAYWKILNPEQAKYLKEKRDRLRAEKNNK